MLFGLISKYRRFISGDQILISGEPRTLSSLYNQVARDLGMTSRSALLFSEEIEKISQDVIEKIGECEKPYQTVIATFIADISLRYYNKMVKDNRMDMANEFAALNKKATQYAESIVPVKAKSGGDERESDVFDNS